MTSKPDADARLVDAHDLAVSALREITPAATIGPAAGYLLEDDGSVSLRFENRLPGYPGWYWTVTVARVEDEEPTVLEIELLPGDGALLAPEWVPWVERLAEYRSHQAELAEAAAAAGTDDESEVADDADSEGDELEDDDELDDDDELEDDHEADILHAGDLDGVDIDELDESTATGSIEDDEEEEDDEDENVDADDDVDADEVDEEE